MTLGEIIEQKKKQGITVVIGCSTKRELVTLYEKKWFRKVPYTIGEKWDVYFIEENGVETLRVESKKNGLQNKLYDHGELIERPYGDVNKIFCELKSLHEAPEIRKKEAQKAKETEEEQRIAEVIENQKRRVYCNLPTENKLNECRLTLDGIIAAKKQNGSKIDIECDFGKGANSLRIMENGKPILWTGGYWSDNVAHEYMDTDWLDTAEVCLYAKDGTPWDPDDIWVETCMSIFEDVFGLYNVQEKEKKEAKRIQEAANRQERVNAIYAQWANGKLQGNQRGGAC